MNLLDEELLITGEAVISQVSPTMPKKLEPDSSGPPTKIVKMEVKPFTRSPVDIIIPFHGQYDKVAKLLSSIIYAVKSNPYQITIVDDASPNKNFIAEFKSFDKKRPQGTQSILKLVQSKTHIGFGGAVNLGLKYTQQPYVMILHSDCLVEDPNWMIEMGRSLLNLKSQNVKMVSARTQNPYPGASPRIKARKEDKHDDFVLEEGFLPMFCVMCHRELFNRVGPIKSYPFYQYEDEEFGHRMRYYGYKQAICGRSWINHEGSATAKPMLKDDPELYKVIDANRDRCVEDLKMLYSRK